MSFAVYKSSAGSGKTFTLVKEYLKLVLPEPDKFRHVLAITFTNKAANEMKERVLDALRELSKPSVTRQTSHVTRDLLPALVSETKLPEEEIAIKAGESLRLILHDYSDFAIGTIDSFSHRIIRTFAHDFGLPVNFLVELDSDELLSTAVDLLMDKVGEDPALTKLLVRFIETRMDDEHDWNIERILLNFARILLDEEGKPHLDQLRDLSLEDFTRIAGSLQKEVAVFEAGIRSIAEKAINLIRSSGIPDSAFYQGRSGISKYFEKLSKGDLDALEPNSYVLKTIAEDKWTSGSCTAPEKELINSIRPELIIFYSEIQRHSGEGKDRYYLSLAVLSTLFPMAVLNAIGQLLDAFKKQNNLIHISEFNQRISGFILREPVPFIYERLGEKFNHILIDEFQDTSILQWRNLLPLVDNALSSGSFNLVVGDGKQAIYRWRNGDVRQFAGLPAIPGSSTNKTLAEHERILRDHYEMKPLDTNFRSKTEIVEFNNAFFSALKSFLSPANQSVYEGVAQKARPGETGGYIRIEFAGRDLKGQQYREFILSGILQTIRDQESAGFRKQDIAILCRRNREGSEIARFLLENDVDVISAESMLLIHSPEVNFLTGMLRLVYGNYNVVLLAELITYLFNRKKLAATGLHELLSKIPPDPDDAFFFRLIGKSNFSLSPGLLKTRPVYDAVEEMIRVFFTGTAADPYIQFFLDTVLKYSRKHSTGAADFLEWWDDNNENISIVMPDGMDAVRIMTIHKAKGLQFPVVLLPFYSDKKMYTRRYLWVDLPKEEFDGLPAAMLDTGGRIRKTRFSELSEEENQKTLLDTLNLLYVAMTRPEERLYMFSPAPSRNASATETAPAFIHQYLIQASLWSDEKSVYEFGLPSKHETKNKDGLIVKRSLTNMISEEWRDKIFIRKSAPESWDVEEPQKNRQWGNLVHTAFARINQAGEEEAVLQKMTDEGMIDPGQMEQLLKKIRTLLSDPVMAPFFTKDNTLRIEAEILRETGEIYRPDRVILNRDQAVVLDFKTGRMKEDYKKQISLYGKLLNEMGYNNVKKYLVFVEPEVNVVEV
ncbi:MAG: UvrD-helicase domain-containing protein [Bacteroidetes bacterium]|nr:UvrD-helicase domain-containing protein [Bacteroidota bacterium]